MEVRWILGLWVGEGGCGMRGIHFYHEQRTWVRVFENVGHCKAGLEFFKISLGGFSLVQSLRVAPKEVGDSGGHQTVIPVVKMFKP